MKRALLVFSDQDEDLARSMARHLVSLPEVFVDAENDRSRALQRLRDGHYDYVVVGARLAADSTSAVRDDGGLEFCKALRQESSVELGLVLFAPNNGIQSECQQLHKPPAIFFVDSSLNHHIGETVQMSSRPVRRLAVVINAVDGPIWRYRLEGLGFPYLERGELDIGRPGILGCRALSLALDDVHAQSNWYERFASLGQYIIASFCHSNKRFGTQLAAGLELAGGAGQAHVVFEVDRSNYLMTLEAIFPPEEDIASRDPWMLQALLQRKVRAERRGAGELFDEPVRPLRCLLLCAATNGMAEIGQPDEIKEHLQLRRLYEVSHEVQDVLGLLQAGNHRVAINPDVRMIGHDQPLTRTTLMDALRENQWDIIHYAGHSYSKRTKGLDDRGFIFVGPPDEPEAIEINDVAPYLRGSRLLYLSSCDSTSASFVLAAAKEGVPAVVGFRWPVGDEQAARHAHLFYEHLLQARSVDDALLKAKRTLHHSDSSDKTWASSMLVTSGQTREP